MTSSSASSEEGGDVSGPITAQQQTEQESFLSDIFKLGWGSNEKKNKQTDDRATVTEVKANDVGACRGFRTPFKIKHSNNVTVTVSSRKEQSVQEAEAEVDEEEAAVRRRRLRVQRRVHLL